MQYKKTILLKDGRACTLRSRLNGWKELMLMRLELNAEP